MKIHIYVFRERSALIEPERLHPVDDHLIRAMHIESVYDVYQYVGCFDAKQLQAKGLIDLIAKLEKYGEVVVRDNEAKLIAEILGIKEPVKFIVLRVKRAW